MSVDYTAKAASAKSILNKFGAFGHVKIKRDDGVLDPVLGTNTGTITEFSLYAVDLDVNKNLMADSRIAATDRQVIMASDTKPLMSDTISIGTADHKIITIDTLSPSGVDVIYTVICRA